MKNANVKTSEASEVVELTLDASSDKSEVERLQATIDKVANSSASSAFDYLVASCALCLDKLDTMTDRNTLMTLTNERANFVALKSNVSSDASVYFDMQDTVHRTYVKRIKVRKQHNNDSLLDVRVRRSNKRHVSTARETADYSYRLLSLKLSAQALKLIAAKRQAIIEAYANDDYKKTLKSTEK